MRTHREKRVTMAAGLAVVVLGLWLAQASWAAPLLQGGDRLVFYGDSITEQAIYPRYVMNYFALRYPGVAVSFRNAGWSGDTAAGGLNRLQRDVLSLKPTVVSICFGMNDAGYRPFDTNAFAVYMRSMTGLVAQLQSNGVKVVLLTPGCVDPDRNQNLKPYNDSLAGFAAGVKEIAAKEHLPVFDIHALMLDVQTRAKADNPQFTMIPDGVHPNAPGAALMAYGLLKALGCTAEASSVVVDAVKTSATGEHCRVTDLKVTTNAVHFIRTDEALPTFFDPEAAAIFKYCSIVQDLDQYTLKVTGLAAGNWKLTVQGAEVGRFAAEALAQGVNLATMPGPWQTLGAEANRLAAEQHSLYYMRWRQFSLVGVPAEAKPELDALLHRMDQIVQDKETARQALAVKDHAWSWSLERVP